jgi:hypothetical protein
VDQDTNKIKQHIDWEREELGRNLDEFQHRVNRATDIRGHVDRNFGWVLGATAACGFLLGIASRRSSAAPLTHAAGFDSSERIAGVRRNPRLGRLYQTMGDIFDGLVGVASGKLQSLVADTVPGFREQMSGERQWDRPSARRI